MEFFVHQFVKEATPKFLCLKLKAPFLVAAMKLENMTYELISRFVDKAVPFAFRLVVKHCVS